MFEVGNGYLYVCPCCTSDLIVTFPYEIKCVILPEILVICSLHTCKKAQNTKGLLLLQETSWKIKMVCVENLGERAFKILRYLEKLILRFVL